MWPTGRASTCRRVDDRDALPGDRSERQPARALGGDSRDEPGPVRVLHVRRSGRRPLLVTTDDNGQHHVNATSVTPFDIIYGPDSRALVHEARLAQRAVTSGSTGQKKETAETGGLYLDVLSDNLIALVESSSKTILVGLLSSHANGLRKAHRFLGRGARPDRAETTTSARPRVQPRVSDAQVHRITEGYAPGKTVYELATEFNCHRVTISAVLKRRGVTLRHASPTPEQVNEMVRLYENGFSLAQVGKRLDFNASTVLTQLRSRQVTTRSR